MKKGKLLYITFALLLAFLYVILNPFFIKHEINSPVEIHISRGMNFTDVTALLWRHQIIRHPRLFVFWGKIRGLQYKIKHGTYRFEGRLSDHEVLQKLVSGDVELVKVTIPEGFNLWQIAERLDALEITDKNQFLKASRDRDLLNKLHIDAPSVEGYLFPDTYFFPKHTEAKVVITRMVENMRSHLSSDMLNRAKELGLTEKGLLTLASLIEKEAKVDDERPLISAVFHNRLRRGMPLESDPTAVYGIEPVPKRVYKKDLLRNTPYNTYRIKGLPPGPIASPGLKSIMAALYPADVPFLYFVATKDGRHHFSRTEKEHQRAVRKYRTNHNK